MGALVERCLPLAKKRFKAGIDKRDRAPDDIDVVGDQKSVVIERARVPTEEAEIILIILPPEGHGRAQVRQTTNADN